MQEIMDQLLFAAMMIEAFDDDDELIDHWSDYDSGHVHGQCQHGHNRKGVDIWTLRQMQIRTRMFVVFLVKTFVKTKGLGNGDCRRKVEL